VARSASENSVAAEKGRGKDAPATVRACPWCGRRLQNSCYHEGHDVQAEDLPYEKWRKLWMGTLRDLIAEAEDAVENLPGWRAELAELEG
jgi:hypothetical protein